MTNQKLPFSYQKITISYVDAAPLFRKNKNRTDSVPTSPCKDAGIVNLWLANFLNNFIYFLLVLFLPISNDFYSK